MSNTSKRRKLISSKSKPSLNVIYKGAESQDQSINTEYNAASVKLSKHLGDDISVRSRRSSVSSIANSAKDPGRPQTPHNNVVTERPAGELAISSQPTLRKRPSWLKDVPEVEPAQPKDTETKNVSPNGIVMPPQTAGWMSYLYPNSSTNEIASGEQMPQAIKAPDAVASSGLERAAAPLASRPSDHVRGHAHRSSWYWPFAGTSEPDLMDLDHADDAQIQEASASIPISMPLSDGQATSEQQPSSVPDALNRGWLSYLYPSPNLSTSPSQTIINTSAQSVVNTASSIPLAVSVSGSSQNPVIETVPNSRSAWTSFFSSRAALPPASITDSGANEPESMEVDFSLSTAHATSQPIKRVPSTSSFLSMNRSTSSRPGSTRDSVSSPQMQQTNDPEPPKSGLANPLTKSHTINKKAKALSNKISKTALTPPNFVLPAFVDTFSTLPRSSLPYSHRLSTLQRMGSYLFSAPPLPVGEVPFDEYLPRSRDVLGTGQEKKWKQIKRIVILGVHGWFPGNMMRTLFGEPTGTSTKFANMQLAAVKRYVEDNQLELDEDGIMVIPLEGEGRVEERVAKLHARLEANAIWIEALQQADAIFVATHSQGCVVSAHLLERLLQEGMFEGHKVHMLCLAAVSNGPFVHLNSSYLLQPYFNYIENAAARELFEYQNPHSVRSKKYQESLLYVLNRNVRVLFVGSLNDQVVPLYSSVYSSFNHPNILRAVFVDGQSFRAIDFACNLVAFALRLKNASLDDHGLVIHLSESLQGALSGVGHSSIYNESSIYDLAIRYLLETEIPIPRHLPSLTLEACLNSHNPREPVNPYFLPWALRGILEEPMIRKLFADELSELREEFEHWQPVAKPLKDVKYRLNAFSTIPRKHTSQLATSSTSTQASKL